MIAKAITTRKSKVFFYFLLSLLSVFKSIDDFLRIMGHRVQM